MRHCASAWTRVLAQLSPEHRAVIELTYFHGHSCKEIAEIVGCPVATVKTRMFYARRHMKDLARRRRGASAVNGHVLPFEGHAHRDVERLLPWYANAHARSRTSDARVRAHLIECAACRAELAALRAVMELHAADRRPARNRSRLAARMRGRLHAARRAPAARDRLAPRARRLVAARRPWMRVARRGAVRLHRGARDVPASATRHRRRKPITTLSADACTAGLARHPARRVRPAH